MSVIECFNIIFNDVFYANKEEQVHEHLKLSTGIEKLLHYCTSYAAKKCNRLADICICTVSTVAVIGLIIIQLIGSLQFFS